VKSKFVQAIELLLSFYSKRDADPVLIFGDKQKLYKND
jgi:hypothetical protein